MTHGEDSRLVVANVVLQRWLADRALGADRALADYQRDFPDFADVVAAELQPLLDERTMPLGPLPGDGAGPRASPAPLPPPPLAPPPVPTSVGPYEVRAELGRGGQATVYLAFDPRLQREVALKVLQRGLSGLQQEQRLQREAATAARVDDTGICPIFDIGHDGEHVYLAMKYIAGETLAQWLDGQRARGERPAWPAVLELFERLCASLHRAHTAGVVHRDLKPANVMIDGEGRPVLLDFGLAVATDETGSLLTRSGDLFGTPAWLPPERLLGRHRGDEVRGDVWALAVCLYEALTLQRPFTAPTLDALYRAILSEPAPDPRRLRPDLPRALSAVLEVALAKEPLRRYGTAADLGADLAAVRRGEPIRARPPGPLVRLWQWHRRHAVAATAGWLLLAGLSAAVTIQRVMLADVHEAQRETGLLNDFLVEKLIFAVTPQEARGREITVAEVFDQATRSVAEAFPEPTRVAGTLQHVLGVANKRLGRLTAARQSLEQAVAVRSRVLGADDRATLQSRFELAQLTRQTDGLAAAERELRAVLAAQTAGLGPADRDTLETRQEQVRVWLAAARAEEAERASRSLVADCRAAFGPDDRVSLTAEHYLARALSDLGRRDEAEVMMRSVYTRRLARFGPDSIAVNDSCNDLANVLHDLALIDGKAECWQEAGELHAANTAFAARVYGKQSQAYATALNNLASFLQDRGRRTGDRSMLQAAIEPFRDSLALREAIEGPESTRAATAAGNLGVLFVDLQEYAKALPFVRRALAIREKVSGRLHPLTLQALANVMLTVRHAEGPAAALPLVDDMLERIRASTELDAKTGVMLRLLALNALLVNDRFGRVIDEGERVWADAQRLWPEGSRHAQQAADMLRTACEADGRTKDAAIWRARSTPAQGATK